MNNRMKMFIRKNYNKLPPDDIADQLDIPVERVVTYIKDYILPKKKKSGETPDQRFQKIVIRNDLRGTEAWKALSAEFNDEELRYFEEAYVKLMTQFKSQGGILPAEETQIFQLIKFEILMSRNLRERRRARDEVDRLERIRDDFIERFRDSPNGIPPADQAFIINIDGQISAARDNEQSRTTEYVKLQERHDALMKSLKAVRDQRIKQIEGAKTDFLSVIKMLQERSIQDKKGRQMELVRLAAQKATQDLGNLHRYEDGTIDPPILSSTTNEANGETNDS